MTVRVNLWVQLTAKHTEIHHENKRMEESSYQLKIHIVLKLAFLSEMGTLKATGIERKPLSTRMQI